MNIRQWWRQRRELQRANVIRALRAHPEEPVYVVARCAGLGYGRLYVILADLEDSGLVTARWQDGPYPRRRLYRLADTENPT